MKATSGYRASSLRYCLGLPLIALLVLPLAHATETKYLSVPSNNEPETTASPFQGILSPEFGKWIDGEVPIAYNPLGAPAGITDELIEANLKTAIRNLENVAQLRFDYIGQTSARSSTFDDGLVVIEWDDLPSTVAASAGPFGNRLSTAATNIFVYTDGRVTLNANTPESATSISTLTHELIHLLGFGHSENPISVMNVSYHRFSYPQQDDIDGLQLVYGPPDEQKAENNKLDLRREKLRVGISVDLGRTKFYSWSGVESEFAVPIDVLTTDVNADHLIYFGVDYANGHIGERLISQLTDPIGNSYPPNEEPPFASESKLTFIYLSTAKRMLALPGNWRIDVGIEEGLLISSEISSLGSIPQYNRTPTATLNVQSDNQGAFDLTLHVSDFENDPYNIRWIGPKYLADASEARNLTVQSESDQPEQIYVEITDSVNRGIVGGDAKGFATLLRKYLITPAEPGVATYFTSQNLLYIPSIDLGGVAHSMIFKLTALDGVSLKLIELDVLSNSTTSPQAHIDADGKIVIPRLIANDTSHLLEYRDLRFSILEDASPIRITLAP